MAPPKKSATSRPGRALAVLVVLIIVILVAITGKDTFNPGRWRHDFRVQLGLDLSSGTSVTLTAETLNGKSPPGSYMKEAIAIMTARVNGAGFSGAQVQQQGANTIVVTVPGKGSNQVVNLVGTTALLYFRQVLLEGGPGSTASASPATTPSPGASSSPSSSTSPSASPSPSGSASTSAHAAGVSSGTAGTSLASGSRLLAAKPKAGKTAKPSASASPSASATPSGTASAPPASAASGDVSLVTPAVRKLFDKLNCANPHWKQQIGYYNDPGKTYDNQKIQIVACGSAAAGQQGLKYVLAPAQVAGTDITSATAGLPSSSTSLNTSAWEVDFSLNGKGSSAFGTLTTQMYDHYGTGCTTNSAPVLDDLAVELDGSVVSAPCIQQPITGGSGVINGAFTQKQASLLAQELNYGALPVALRKQNIESVSPQLGRNQLDAGLIAAAIGLGLVVIYSFLYYRGLGIVSVSSLIVAGFLAYGCVVLLSKYSSSGFTLSLAGIAGLIVAIGITADSFVVFFERLRDEVREGKSLRPAVESGWRRARRTILVSDTVSFLAALLLWYFSISDVKGFAFTLGLTTLIDVVVVFLFTKPMVTLLARTKFFGGGHPLSGLDPARLGARAPWRSGLPRTTSRVKEA